MPEPAIPRRNASAVPVSEAEDQLLEDFVTWLPQQKEATRQRWADVAQAAEAELETRRRKPGSALARVEQETAALIRISEPNEISRRLGELSEQFHLVAPATEIEHVPAGFGVSVSMVHISQDNFSRNGKWLNVNKRGPGDVYEVGGGKVGLSKRPLEQIWAAAGGTWDMVATGRLDDASDPRYIHFRAVGTARNYDGTPRQVSGEVEMDLRDGSDQYNEIVEKAKERQADPNFKGRRDDGAGQLLELRKFLLRHAESKAKNRAIASLGVKRSYYPNELEKPFAVARLTFTGQTEDPELRREFARMTAQAALGGAQTLYGSGAAAPAALPAAPSDAGHAPPPVGEAIDVEGDDIPDFGDPEPGTDEEEMPT